MSEIIKDIDTKLSENEKNKMLANRNRIRKIYWAMAEELRGWDIRSAFAGGAASAVVYVTFIKYISDRREQLGLRVSDLYRFDALCSLYPSVVDQRELCEYLGDVEEQLGFSHRLFQNFVSDITPKNMDAKFSSVLRLASDLDFSSKDITAIEVEELILIVEKLADLEGKTSGFSYTPSSIASLMGKICEVKDGMTIYDPCAGCGVSLVQATKGRKVEVFAQEQNSHIAAVLEMLLIMSGIREGVVRCDDSVWHPLTQTLDQKFDCVISEPPYMKPEIGYRTSIDEKLIDHVLYYPEQRIEDTWVFIRHIVASLKFGGKAAVLLPMSMLTREGASSASRQRMVKDGYIDSVIELPANVFSNRGIKTSILVLRKDEPARSVYMLDLSRGLWNEKLKEGEVGIAAIAEMVINHEVVTGISDIVKTDDIAANNYQLAVSRYVAQEIDVEQFITDSVKLYETAEQLESKFTRLCKEFREALEDYNGYCNQKKTD
ncbi:MAG: N-6 DNA methylase [Eubacteriales bacterium]|nr:N-6 DNA methylase [Eubacteriales bacterium]